VARLRKQGPDVAVFGREISAGAGARVAGETIATGSVMKIAKHVFCVAALALAATLSALPALAKPAYVLSTVNLRAAPGTTNEIVGKIPGGTLVETDSCTDGWCAVTWQGKSGFAIQTALDLSGRVPQRRAAPSPGYYGGPAYDDEVVVEGPPVYYAPPPPYYYGYYGRPYWGWRHRW
jgi:uncharacterized protein YraI